HALHKNQATDIRKQSYYETVLTREDWIKEVTVYNLSRYFIRKYLSLFNDIFQNQSSLTIRRGIFVSIFTLISTTGFYACYAWVALEAINSRITIGDMTMYIVIFRQAQLTISSL